MAERASWMFDCLSLGHTPLALKFGPVNQGKSASRESTGISFTSVACDQFYLKIDWGNTLRHHVQWGYNMTIKIEGQQKIRIIDAYPLDNMKLSVPTTVQAYWNMAAYEVLTRATQEMIRYVTNNDVSIVREDEVMEGDTYFMKSSLTCTSSTFIPAFTYEINLLSNNVDMLQNVKPYITKMNHEGHDDTKLPAMPELLLPTGYANPYRLNWTGKIAQRDVTNIYVNTLLINPYSDGELGYDHSSQVSAARAIEVRLNGMPIPEVYYVGSNSRGANQGLNSEGTESINVLANYFLGEAPKAFTPKPIALPIPAVYEYTDNNEWLYTPPLSFVYRTATRSKIDLYEIPGINETLLVTYAADTTKRKILFKNSDWQMDNVDIEIYLRSKNGDVLEAYQKNEDSSQLGIKLYAPPLNH